MGKISQLISSAFNGRTAVLDRRDIPGRLATWLFRVGTIWAALLAPVIVIACALTIIFLLAGLVLGKPYGPSREMWLCPYLLAGYAIWLGWGWRSLQPRNKLVSILFWLASAGFHVIFPVHIRMDAGSFLGFLGVTWNPLLLWEIAATGMSLLALGFEFSRPNILATDGHK
jgi:hypothetical protein